SNRQIVFESPIKINVPITRQSEYFIRSKDVNGKSAPFDDVALLQEGAMTNRCVRPILQTKTVEVSGSKDDERQQQKYEGIPALAWPSSPGDEKSSSNRTKSDIVNMSGKSFSEDRSLSFNLKKKGDYIDDNLLHQLTDAIEMVELQVTGEDGLALVTTSPNGREEYFVKNRGIYVPLDDRIQVSLDNTKSPPTVGQGPLQQNKYDFVQAHFHWGRNAEVGSEHTIEGQHFSAEVRTIVIFHSSTKLKSPLVLRDLLPHDISNFFSYNGSLTTPPCSEVVNWIVFTYPVPIGTNQALIIEPIENYGMEDELI
uniref:carbonic anhydrase n=1 Tax=Romanomermis culicivorax TaxID=13658 RepID=A0A915K2S5_ROMCU